MITFIKFPSQHTIQGKSFEGEILRFLHFFTQLRMFSVESFTRLDISLLKKAATMKVFPLMFIFDSNCERFAVYGIVCVLIPYRQ